MKEIYVVLTKSNSILSHVIDLLLPSQYTHASIAFDPHLDEMYSIGRIYTFLTYPAHMKKEHLDKGFFHFYKQTKIGVYSVIVSDISYIKMKNYVDKLYEDNKKLRYSSLGLLLCRLNIEAKRKNRMFCSEFVCNVLKQAEEGLIDKLPELCTPTDLLTTKGLKKEYIGTISDLAKTKANTD